MDALLDGPLAAYTPRRVAMTLVLPLGWFVAFPTYTGLYTSRVLTEPELASLGCTCDAPVLDATSICGACEAAGGTLTCEPSEHLIASSFQLYCEDESVLALTSTFVTVGIMLGALLGGVLSDSMGRRPTLLLGLAIESSFSLLTALAPTFGTMLFFRLCVGVGVSFVSQAGYTLSAEIVGPRLRTVLTIEIWAYCWAAMACSSALLAFSMRGISWRWLEVVVAVLQASLGLIQKAVVLESPRWLLANGQATKAQTVLQLLVRAPNAASEVIHGAVTPVSSEGFPVALRPATSATCFASEAEPICTGHVKSDAYESRTELYDAAAPPSGVVSTGPGKGVMQSVYALFSNATVARITTVQLLVWASCNLAFYGIAFNAAALSDNICASLLFPSMLSVLGHGLGNCARVDGECGLDTELNRKSGVTMLLGMTTVSLAVGALWSENTIIASMFGSFASTGAFNIVYIQIPELYPTSVRNTALGIASATARVAVIISTQLPSALGSTDTLLLIASSCFFATFLSWAFIPETRGKGLPEALPGHEEVSHKIVAHHV